MPFSKMPFKKNSSQRPVKLDDADILVLKELASFFLSVNFQGSQLESLLLARASQAPLLADDADRIIPSILTPSPNFNPSSASESEADADGTTRRLEAEPGAVSTHIEPPLDTLTPTRPNVQDNSFEGANIGGIDPTEIVEINNLSFNEIGRGYDYIEDRSFHGATVAHSNVTSNSYNNNVGSFISTINAR